MPRSHLLALALVASMVMAACAGTDSGSRAGSAAGTAGQGSADEGADGGDQELEQPPDVAEVVSIAEAVPDDWVAHRLDGVTILAPADQAPSGYADDAVDIAIHPLADDTAEVRGEIELWQWAEPFPDAEALLEGAECGVSGTDLAFGRDDSTESERTAVTFMGQPAVLCVSDDGSAEARLVVIAVVDEEAADALVRVAVTGATREEAEGLAATALGGLTFT